MRLRQRIVLPAADPGEPESQRIGELSQPTGHGLTLEAGRRGSFPVSRRGGRCRRGPAGRQPARLRSRCRRAVGPAPASRRRRSAHRPGQAGRMPGCSAGLRGPAGPALRSAANRSWRDAIPSSLPASTTRYAAWGSAATLPAAAPSISSGCSRTPIGCMAWRDAHPAQVVVGDRLLAFAPRGDEDKDGHQTQEEAAGEQRRQPHQHGRPLAQPRRHLGRATERHECRQHGAHEPSAIHRERRDQVEERQQQVVRGQHDAAWPRC